MLEFRVLGPVRVVDGEHDVALSGARQRAILASLVLRANHVVSREQLADDVWGADPPGSWHALQMQVSRLRRTLREAAGHGDEQDYLLTREPGYLLDVAPDRVDATQFEHLLELGRAALSADRAEEASAGLAAALALWRGPALADVPVEGSLRSEAVRLDELRLAAVELRVDADLRLGRHQTLVAELRALVTEHPLRERLWRQLVVSLYRSSRQAEALEALRSLRENLGEELGIDPSPTLQDLERSILQQDRGLRAAAPPGTPRTLVGADLGGYGIERVLGRGSTSVVFLAEDLALGRKVALKVLTADLARDPEFRARFVRESHVAASIDHPNVIPIYGAGEADGVLYVAMRLVAGSTLAKLISSLGPLPAGRVASLVAQVAEALDAAHAAGLVHRDVKPSNVLIAEAGGDDHTYLTDFGIATELGAEGTEGSSGSFDYAAPEVLRGGRAVAASDEYALACMAIEALTGEPPFRRRPEEDQVEGAGRATPPSVVALRPELGAGVDVVFRRAMAAHGEGRYGSCCEFAAALSEALLGAEPGRDRVPALPVELDPVGPLFGRQPELDWLAGQWREAADGPGRVALLVGDRGIGKTRLAAEFARTAHLGGASVAHAGCLGPADAVARAVAFATTTPGPTVLVLDDVDAAGSDSMEVLAGVPAQVERSGLLVVATCRAAESRAAGALFGGEAPAERVCRLDPLDTGAVAGILATYAPEGGAGGAESILREAGGVPLLVHQALAEWVRAESARRLDVEAGAARGRREDLRASEEQIVERVRDLRLADERVQLVARADATDAFDLPIVCPFRGLAPFDVADSGYFFGRERLVGTLVARLVGAGLLAVVGPSGSGKSSAVRAGLVPALGAGVIPGSEGWAAVIMRPGEHPASELGAALKIAGPVPARPAGAAELLEVTVRTLERPARLLLVVDQFEEVFTTCRDEAERAAFIEALVRGATDPAGRIVVVIAIRADYYGRCAAYPPLADLVGANQVLVGPMEPSELRRAIEMPAGRAGLRVEQDLTEALVADVAGQPGSLPLMSTALLELWERRDGRWLRARTYAESGGVRAAVAGVAERTYGRLGREEREEARAILLRLAGPGEGDSVVRIRVPLSEFDGRDRADVRGVLDVLAAGRLVTVDEGTVEVAHEALLREWPRLRGWLDEDARGRAVHRHLIGASRDWEERGRDPADLYRGARLSTATEWADAHGREMNDLEREFVARSRTASEDEIHRSRRTVRRLRALLAGMVVFLVLALVAGGVALVQGHRAQEAAFLADSRFLASESLLDDRVTRALLLSVEAYLLDDSALSRGALLASLQRSPQSIGIIHVSDAVDHLALSPDAAMLAVGESDGTVELVETAPGGAHVPLPGPGSVDSLAFGRGGATLAVGRSSLPGSDRGTTLVEVIDVRTGRTLFSHRWVQEPAGAALAYSRDGSRLAMVVGEQVVVRDAATDDPVDTVTLGWTGESLAFLPTGEEVVVTGRDADGQARTVRVDLSGRTPNRTYELGGRAIDVSPDGTQVVVADGIGDAALLTLQTGREQPVDAGGSDVQVARFAGDGDRLAVSTGENFVDLVEAASGFAVERFTGHAGAILDEVIDPGGTLYTGSDDKTVMVWDLTGRRTLVRPFRFQPGARSALAYGPRIVAVAEGGDAISLLDADTLVRLGRLTGSTPIEEPVISRDSTRIAALAGGRLVEWRLPATGPDGRSEAPLPDSPPYFVVSADATPVSFSPDGGLLAVLQHSTPAGIDVLDAETGDPVPGAFFPLPGVPIEAVFDRGWSEVAVDFENSHTVRTYRVSGGRSPGISPGIEIPGGGQPTALAISGDGRLVAIGREDGRIAIADMRTGDLHGGRSVSGHANVVEAVDFDGSGRILASSDRTGTSLWDVGTHRQLGTELSASDAVFDPAADRLFVIDGATGSGAVWDLDVQDIVARACRVAGRNLSTKEWQELVPDLPYRTVCPSLP
jgi:DNA-binding SARP family transcriptional activator/WD40 repeat protein